MAVLNVPLRELSLGHCWKATPLLGNMWWGLSVPEPRERQFPEAPGCWKRRALVTRVVGVCTCGGLLRMLELVDFSRSLAQWPSPGADTETSHLVLCRKHAVFSPLTPLCRIACFSWFSPSYAFLFFFFTLFAVSLTFIFFSLSSLHFTLVLQHRYSHNFFILKSWHSRTPMLWFMILKRTFCHKFLLDVVRHWCKEIRRVVEERGWGNEFNSGTTEFEGGKRQAWEEEDSEKWQSVSSSSFW